MQLSIQNCRVQPLLPSMGLPVDVLRLDLIHPVVSGNKWFKLKEYLKAAKAANKTTLLTFGGAYSNHIVATAAAAQQESFKSIGIIRGEEPEDWSPTLLAARKFGMQFFFTSRSDYKNKQIPDRVFDSYPASEIFIIPEGGYGRLGAEGAASILQLVDLPTYTHIVSAVGTGTTLAGLTNAVLPHQKIIGIPVLKNAFSLHQEIEALLPPEKTNSFQLLHKYHFGGYAKHSPKLLQFMNSFFEQTGIPTDFVYTAKSFYATLDLFKQGFFTHADKVLLVHTGGLQGNAPLSKGTLIFG